MEEEAMTFYRQQEATDCLLATLECFIQRSRDDFKDLCNWMVIEGQRYFSYKGFADVCRHYGTTGHLYTADKDTVLRIDGPMILGLDMGYACGSLHAMFYDGTHLYDPWNGLTLNRSDLKIVYAIKAATPGNMDEDTIQSRMAEWHTGMMDKMAKRPDDLCSKPYDGPYWAAKIIDSRFT